MTSDLRKSHVCIWGEGRGNSWCKGPEAGISLAYSRTSGEAPVAQQDGWEGGDEGRLMRAR